MSLFDKLVMSGGPTNGGAMGCFGRWRHVGMLSGRNTGRHLEVSSKTDVINRYLGLNKGLNGFEIVCKLAKLFRGKHVTQSTSGSVRTGLGCPTGRHYHKNKVSDQVGESGIFHGLGSSVLVGLPPKREPLYENNIAQKGYGSSFNHVKPYDLTFLLNNPLEVAS